MTINIFIIGGGATASALAKKLSHNENISHIYIATDYMVASDKYETVDIRADDLTELLKFAVENEVTITIPISETALEQDIVSFFLTNGQNIFGPIKDACCIALNKTLGKKFLYKIHAQTSKFGIFDKINMAQDWLNSANFPVTIRCNKSNNFDDRLVCPTIKLANEFLENLFIKGETNILIEEYTFGHNFTIYYVTDGYSILPLATVGNYKFMQDGDGGILTNGIGCYSPDFKISATVEARVGNVAKNTILSLEKNGIPYVGILGIDCTLTGNDKFYINEFKPSLQAFDAAAVLNSIDEDLIKLFVACTEGYFSDEYENLNSSNYSSVSAVISSRQALQEIKGLNFIEDGDNIDFINVKQTPDGKYLTNIGENFVITHTSSTLNRAKKYMYEDLSCIKFSGMKYRKDILKLS